MNAVFRLVYFAPVNRKFFCMRWLIILLFAINSFNAAGQTKGIALFLRDGYTYAPGAKQVPHQITPHMITGFSNDFTILGLEGYYRQNKWIIGLEGTMGVQSKSS